ncbi:hypothetical protein K440DRAFT_618226 [Wilcoxina mikolae CBS 423.85]|nr:hypothetical protein K440DRAFT_618226 [Wilcoxina mikolae CBS 423.85]
MRRGTRSCRLRTWETPNPETGSGTLIVTACSHFTYLPNVWKPFFYHPQLDRNNRAFDIRTDQECLA